MSKNKLQKIIINFVILLALLIIFLIPAQTEATNYEASSYNQYQAKQMVIDAFNSHSEISYNKKVALVKKLIEDGFFKMATKQKKLDYIHANLSNNKFLLVVADALDIHSDSHSSDSEIGFDFSQEVEEQLKREALNSYKTWAGFYKYVAKEPGHRYEFGDFGCFAHKNYWFKNHLDQLYAHYWPDLKDNRYSPEFTGEERQRLRKIYDIGNFQKMADNMESWRPPGSIGYFSNSAAEDLLLFVPVEKLVAIAGKACLKKVSGLCGKRVVRKGGRAVKAIRVGARRAVEKITERSAMTIPAKYLRQSFVISIKKMFGKSSIPAYNRSRLAKIMVDSVDNIAADPVIGKYISSRQAKEIIAKTEIWTYEQLMEKSGGLNWAGFARFENGKLVRVVVDENDLLLGVKNNGIMANRSFVHEAFHGLQARIDNYGSKYFSEALKYNPMEEGMNEVLVRKHIRSVWQRDLSVGYKAEGKVAEEIVRALGRRYDNLKKGYDVASWTFFKGGLKKLDDYLGKGVHDHIWSLMDQGRYEDAIKYLRQIN